MDGDVRHSLGRLVAGAVLTFAIVATLPLPVGACSCAAPSDIRAWVDESEAAFVGTMVDVREGGQNFGGPGRIYTFEVEQWVKGDAGDVVEVHSGFGDGDCGYGERIGERIGALVTREGDHLSGSSCSQLDPDVLLTAMKDPVVSSTGVGYLLAANGFNSTRLTVLDESGHHVTELQAPGADPFAGTQHLDVCPGGELFLQTTPLEVFVWDLARLELVATHEIPGGGAGWPSDVSCRDADASSIWVVQSFEPASKVVEVVDGPETIMELKGPIGWIGQGLVVAQLAHEGDAVLIDMASGEETPLTETPDDALHAVYVAPHPSQPLVAVVETRFSTGAAVDATLTLFDRSGAVVESFEIPWESYPLQWLDDDHIAVTVHDWTTGTGRTFGYVVELSTGEADEVESWLGSYPVADDDVVFGVDGGTIVRTELSTGLSESLTTLPSLSAGPLVLLDHDEPATTTTSPAGPATESTPGPTIPPLVAPDLGADVPETGYVRWIAGVAVVGFIAVLIWLGTRKPRDDRAD